MKTCPNCNGQNEEGSIFCSFCGSHLSAERRYFCTHCGNQVSQDDWFCKKCGFGCNGCELPLLDKRIAPRPITVICRYVVSFSDARKGTLMISQDSITFNSGWTILGPGINCGMSMSDVDGLRIFRMKGGIGTLLTLQITTRDDSGSLCLSGPKAIGQSENMVILTDIAYIIELYRRYYWSYIDPKPILVQLRPSFKDDLLKINDVTDEQLFKRFSAIHY